MKNALLGWMIWVILTLSACSTQEMRSAAGPNATPLTTKNIEAVKGQKATCAGPSTKTFNIELIEKTVDLGLGTSFAAWTYNGRIPAPVIEACEGDKVIINMTNKGTTAHGFDTHAMKIDARHYSPVAPGKTMTIEKVVDTPGVFMYHCASGPVTDIHIKSGLNGAMIVYPRSQPLRPARELVVVESAVFGEAGATGLIPGTDPTRAQKNDPFLMMFNGRLEHAALAVRPGDLIRAYVVNIGPGVSAIHVMGTILDTVKDGASTLRNVQTYAVPPGGGAVVEFRIPEAGMY